MSLFREFKKAAGESTILFRNFITYGKPLELMNRFLFINAGGVLGTCLLLLLSVTGLRATNVIAVHTEICKGFRH